MLITLLFAVVASCNALGLPSRQLQAPKEPPPVAADQAVFQPSGKVYSRRPQIVRGKRSSPELDHVTVSWPTVAEAAQVYADFSRKEVRVPRGLLERKLAFGNGTGSGVEKP